jgi:predicted transcriptional regulator of viral defense system
MQKQGFCTKCLYLTRTIDVLYNGQTMDRVPHQQILHLARAGVIRAQDLDARGLPRRGLAELVRAGRLIRIGRGLYMASEHAATENHSLARVCKRVPAGVVCLLSALRFHGLTTQLPAEVWIALRPATRTPHIPEQALRVFRFSGTAYSDAIEVHQIEGVQVRVYGPAKTVADCFKFRNKIGLDVAIEALRDAWSRRLVTADELWHSAKICRVFNIMRPYMDSLS